MFLVHLSTHPWAFTISERICKTVLSPLFKALFINPIQALQGNVITRRRHGTSGQLPCFPLLCVPEGLALCPLTSALTPLIFLEAISLKAL